MSVEARRIPDLSVEEHVHLAERHAEAAYDKCFKEEKHQKTLVRMQIGRAQSILISLITGGKIK